MTLSSQSFIDAIADKQADIAALKNRVYSDVIDDAGLQYVDLVMEGGGVLGIALLGYVYVLEQAGLRFASLGGASAGSITALALAALDVPAAAKSEMLIEIVANMPMADFVDGKDDDDTDASDFLDTILARRGLMKALWKGIQVVDNFSEIMGLNRGEHFHRWLKDMVLKPRGLTTTKALLAQMGTTPTGWRLRDDSLHRESQLEGEPALPPLDPKDCKLCIVAADISTETKLEFPRMAGLYWADVDQVDPADYVRCSMSIPFFFRPVKIPLAMRDPAHERLWCDLAGINEVDIEKKRFPPKFSLIVDGGVLSNFPIDVFHNPLKVPTRPTFGVKLQWDERAHNIDRLQEIVTQTFNAARHCLDYEFLRKNPDFNRLVAYIDTAEHDWLAFSMADAEKLDLFRRGALTAIDFLARFDWQAYKTIRESLSAAQMTAASTMPRSQFRGSKPD
ncbi:patatin-like phospholipase family protein [Cupriavidus basilensis]|uniref:Patatin-like phospholipase family protein n=1 Tax=Cupriavidus basilensis TaxID=68895 RepID=A0ABT6AQ71_9BURK|nr:patatin-like phospholipase family protein [Cupriavidus basilensis]MDF3834764.1 patatin-like phospholipase family protein [Cupriavidus basilensis]